MSYPQKLTNVTKECDAAWQPSVPPSPRAGGPVAADRRGLLLGVLSGPRLSQVALVARDCDQVAGELRRAFGWLPPFHDPGVGRFGLTNAVFAVGDTFVEVVAPAQPDTAAGRYLERRGGDGGYMAIFQVPDLSAARGWAAVLGISAADGRPGPVADAVVELPDPGQRLRFGPASGGRGEGITEVIIAGLPRGGTSMIGGVRFAGEEG
jgi:hypothetical protein